MPRDFTSSWYAPIALGILVCCGLYGIRRSRRLLQSLREQLGRPDERVEKRDIKILSQNCWNVQWPGSEIKGNTGRYAYERFDALVASASKGDYDVLALQELFVLRVGPFVFGEEVAYLQRRLVEVGYIYHTDIAYNLPTFFGQSAGVAVFSRIPIVRSTNRGGYYTFSSTSLKELPTRKGFVHAQLAVSPRQSRSAVDAVDRSFVHIVVAHLDSSSQSSVRLAQINEVVHTVKKITRQETVLVCGDFNISPGRFNGPAEYPFLVKSMEPLVEVFPEVKETYREGGAFDHMFVGRMDGAYQSENINKLVVDKKVVDLQTKRTVLPVSDHLGLAATLRLDST